MAKIVTETITIEVSRIAKDDASLSSVIEAETITTLEQVVQQLVGDSAVVEVKCEEE